MSNNSSVTQLKDDLTDANYPKVSTFDGSKSASSAETIVDFLQNFDWRSTQLQDIPGIGPKSVECLVEGGISTVQQLVGTYMGFVEPGDESKVINDKFYKWFKEKSPKSNGHTVTFAVAHLADKYGIVLYET